MDTRKDANKKTPEPKKTSNNPESVELSVEELEERIAPAVTGLKPGTR